MDDTALVAMLDALRDDVRRGARAALAASPGDADALVADYASCAAWAAESGADAVITESLPSRIVAAIERLAGEEWRKPVPEDPVYLIRHRP